MVFKEGISAHIVVDNTALAEYYLPNTPGAYIECVPDSTFAIFVKILPHAPSRIGDVFILRAFVDGQFFTEAVQRSSGVVQGYLNGAKTASFRFPHVMLWENENEDVAMNAENWDAREVVLEIAQSRLAEESSSLTPSSVEPLGGSDSVLTFTFKYRPRSMLKSLLGFCGSQQRPWNETADVHENPASQLADVNRNKSLERRRNSEIYCYCAKIRPKQPVVTCDNDNCQISSFHLDCVGLKEQPQRQWFCPDCEELPEEELKIDGETKFYGSFKHPKCGCR